MFFGQLGNFFLLQQPQTKFVFVLTFCFRQQSQTAATQLTHAPDKLAQFTTQFPLSLLVRRLANRGLPGATHRRQEPGLRAGMALRPHRADGLVLPVPGTMTPRPKHTKRDACQQDVIDGLRALGAVVWDLADLGGEVLDLMVFWRGRARPVEVKCDGKLTEAQETSIARLRSVGVEPVVAGTAEEVAAAWPE